MRKSRRDGWQQACHAQAVVNADGSRLILGVYVASGSTDAGYVRTKLIERFEAGFERPELFLAITGDDHDLRRYDYRPPKK